MKELLTDIFTYSFIGCGAFVLFSLGLALLRGDFKEGGNKNEK